MTSQVLEELRAAAARVHPKEACGILLGEGAKITAFLETANVHQAPETHFEIDPEALINAYREEREGGPQVLGYFHSHPRGPAKPSATDQKMSAQDGKIWVIYGSREIQFWRDVKYGFEPLSYLEVEA